jgi:hypothetical protein
MCSWWKSGTVLRPHQVDTPEVFRHPIDPLVATFLSAEPPPPEDATDIRLVSHDVDVHRYVDATREMDLDRRAAHDNELPVLFRLVSEKCPELGEPLVLRTSL